MGKKIELTPALKQEYEKLFATMQVKPSVIYEVDRIIRDILRGKPRYEEVTKITGTPWWVIALVHSLECNLSFSKHLHNGDNLAKPTVRVPIGRPWPDQPWNWTWETSAADALRKQRLDTASSADFSLGRLFYLFEGFNGYGYRLYHPDVKTPYLWSGSQHYVRGKYVGDGKFDRETVSKQIGIAVVLKRMLDRGIVSLEKGAADEQKS